MTTSIVLDRDAKVALYQQIAGQLREQIAAGRLPTGAQLPTIRQLADDLGVTRLTVQTAYAELHSNGWIESTVGRGTFVSPQPPALPPAADGSNPPTVAGVIGDILQASQGVRSLASASPDPALFPADEFWACLAHQRDAAATLAGYGPGQGDARLRMALVEVLRERGVAATAGEILVTAGVTQGLALAITALTQPGDVVLVEQPTYIGFLHQLRSAGLQPAGVPLDDGGLRLDVLDRLAGQLRPRFLYTVPSFQNPTGLCADLERRRQVLALARTHGFTVVEDDLYGLLAYDQPAPPALKALDRDDAVVYLTSFSKTFMPGLRLGCLVAPPRLQERFLTLRIAADLGSPPLLQRTLAAFLEDGGLRRHLRRVLPVYRERRDALLAALQATMPPAVRWTRPAGGFCTWLTLPGRSPGGEVARLMRQAGWTVAPGEVFLAQPTGEQHLRLCFGNLAADALARGIQALGQVIRLQAARGEAIGPATGELPPLV